MSDPLPSPTPLIITQEPSLRAESRTRWLGAGLCALSAAGYSGLPILGKLAFAAGMSIAGVLSVRFAGASVLILGYLALRRRKRLYPGARTALTLLGLGLMYGVQATLYFAGLRRIPASLTSVLLYIYPALVALLAWRVNRTKPMWAEIGAVALGLGGVFLTVRPWGIAGQSGAEGLDLVGAAFVVAAAACYSVYILLSGIVVQRAGPLVSTGWITAGAAGFFLVFGSVTHSLITQLPPFGGWILFGMVLFNTILPVVTFLAGLVRVGPTAASLISTLEPVFTVMLATAFLGERLGRLDIAGGLMVLSAAVLVNLIPARLDLGSTEPGVVAEANRDM
jgi:drug/metabolite transporter (DMT)-like permease